MAQVKRIRRNVSGIILLDKPLGFTSNAALQKVRWLLNAEKAGHTGSLDPLATGVLPLCFGEATKFSQYLLDSDKGYETLMQLGKTTTTADAEGEVLQTREVTVGRADIEAVLPEFRGQISQIPPMYSALKRDGQPLYKLARAGEVVEREARSVTIARLELLAFEGDTARLAVDCSKAPISGPWWKISVRSWVVVLTSRNCVAPRPVLSVWPRPSRWKSLRRYMPKAATKRWIAS